MSEFKCYFYNKNNWKKKGLGNAFEMHLSLRRSKRSDFKDQTAFEKAAGIKCSPLFPTHAERGESTVEREVRLGENRERRNTKKEQHVLTSYLATLSVLSVFIVQDLLYYFCRFPIIHWNTLMRL